MSRRRSVISVSHDFLEDQLMDERLNILEMIHLNGGFKRVNVLSE
jgi:hypothetical protein